MHITCSYWVIRGGGGGGGGHGFPASICEYHTASSPQLRGLHIHVLLRVYVLSRLTLGNCKILKLCSASKAAGDRE